ncbi:GNAT family N-acetyltransferase [Vogesella sp. LIG4]|uniref:GNAT family N-acetyltransferase n=1 Tax=Vogesella sp. LIG4 TaxID=1192162 RepID=UPI00082011B1|nr:GNAT family N-acetyltransferase [Vogesella sp. LIG4]SCK25860.1 hypothetical protein PSELUDRAFT_3096 [Vogesella sp. LIG4]
MYTSESATTTPDITIRSGDERDVDNVLPLLVAYRQFYGLESELPALRTFLLQRLQQRQAVLWLALLDGAMAGFALLYPGFSTLSLQRRDLLHDLFVAPQARGIGLGRMLLQAIQAAAPAGSSLFLETAHNNHTAQALYRQTGFVADQHFGTWEWTSA